MICARKVYLRVAETWFYTIFCAVILLFTAGLVLVLTARFGGWRLVLPIVSVWAALNLLLFLLSEPLVVFALGCTRLKGETAKRYPLFVECLDELLAQKWMFRPRCYIAPLGEANAFAFGLGLLGQSAIAISPELYRMLNKAELKAVLAHELGHIRSKDVGLIAALSISTGFMSWLGWRMLLRSRAFGLGSLVFMLLGALCYVLARVIFPMGISAISQEREFSADALSALYCGTTAGLKSALRKLCSAGPGGTARARGIFDDLFISHPWLEARLAQLEKYDL